MSSRITIAHGSHSRATKEFTNKEFSNWREFANYVGEPKLGEKEGECFLQCSLKSKEPGFKANGSPRYSNRYLANAECFSTMGFDLDSGQDPTPIIDFLRRLKIAFVLHSSYSDTPEKRKFRIVILLKSPFFVGDDVAKAKLMWKRLYLAIACHLRLDTDKACLDLVRLFFTARYPAGVDPQSRLFEWSDGDGFDLEPWYLRAEAGEFDHLLPKPPPGKKLVHQRQRKSGERIHAQGIDLVRWVSVTGGTFRTSDVVAENSFDLLNHDVDKSEVVCPFDDYHASCPGERTNGFFVANPNEDYPSFGAHCCHGSCQERDRLDFVSGLIERGDITRDDLKDPKNYVGGDKWSQTKIDEVCDIIDGVVLPSPFFLDYTSGRIMKPYSNPQEGQPRNYPVCGPLKPIATVRNEHGQGYGILVQIRTRDNREKELILKSSMPAKDVANLLRDNGLQVFGNQGAEAAFRELLAALNPRRTVIEATRPSFHANNTIFVTPLGQVIRASGADEEEWRLSSDKKLNAKLSGSLDEWRIHVAVPCLSDPTHIPHLGVGVLSGFVGPVIHWLGFDTCMINLSGPTSRGKTSALKVMASVWGPIQGKESLRFEARGTANAMEALIERGDGVSVGLDELAHCRNVGLLIFAIASGQGNNRMRSDGSGLRYTRRWHTFVLLSGEKSTRAYVEADGQQFIGGMGVRCGDVGVAGLPIHPHPGSIDAILNDASRFNGSAGPAFIEWLLDNEEPDKVRVDIERYQAELAGSAPSGAKLRASLPFAFLAVAGDIAKRAGLIPSDIDHMACVRWASTQARQSSASEALDSVEDSIDEVFKFISANLDGRIVRVPGASSDIHVPAQGAAGWIDRTKGIVYLLWDEFARRCKTDPLTVAKELIKRKVVQSRSKGEGRIDPYHTSLPRGMSSKHIRILIPDLEESESKPVPVLQQLLDNPRLREMRDRALKHQKGRNRPDA